MQEDSGLIHQEVNVLHNVGPLLGEVCIIAGTTILAAVIIALIGGSGLAVAAMVGLILVAWGLYEMGLFSA